MTEIQLSAACFDEIRQKLTESSLAIEPRVASSMVLVLPDVTFHRVAAGRASARSIFPFELQDEEIAAALHDQAQLMKLRQRLISAGFSVSPGLLRSMLNEAR